MYQLKEKVEGKISSLAYGGKGILRHVDAPVIFVPFTAPGDLVECEIIKTKKNYAEAKLLRVIQPGKDRVLAPCPYFGTCGGCQLQHLAYKAQVEHKKMVVFDALRKVYPESPISISEAKQIFSYRRHITLTLHQKNQGYQIGYFTLDNKTLITVKECIIFTKQEDPIFNIIGDFSTTLSYSGDGKVKILKTPQDKYILSFHFKKIPSNFSLIAKKHFKDPIAGILGNSIKEHHVIGQEEINLIHGPYTFKTHPASFLQTHSEISEKIYQAIEEEMKAHPARHLLDLYCGIGITSVITSPYAKTIDAVEMNKKGVALARQNAKAAKTNNIRFYANRVENILDELLKKKPDTAILNPPREGLEKSVAEKIGSSSLQKIIYLSCQPATLSRDLEIFKSHGFLCKKIEAFDMFPETSHVETLIYIERTSKIEF